MGTRHLICIFWKGAWVVAQYGQFDGYPSYCGAKIFRFLSVARNIEYLKAGLDKIYQPSAEELEVIRAECEAWDENYQATTHRSLLDMRVTGVRQLYPSLARETSARILGLISSGSMDTDSQEDDGDEKNDAVEGEASGSKEAKKLPMVLSLSFVNDTLFCEWAYVVDLDKEIFEVYGGSDCDKNDDHRLKDVGSAEDPVPCLVRSFTFDEVFLMKSEAEFLQKIDKVLKERGAVDSEC